MRCEIDVIAIGFDCSATTLGAIGDNPSTWLTARTGVDGLVEIEAVHLEISEFDPSTEALCLYADEQRQYSLAGRARPIWSYRPAFATACPAWLVPGPDISGGYRAECRLPLPPMRVSSLRLWTGRTAACGISGSVFYRRLG